MDIWLFLVFVIIKKMLLKPPRAYSLVQIHIYYIESIPKSVITFVFLRGKQRMINLRNHKK